MTDKKDCICDDLLEANAKFMHGWRYCAYCGAFLETKIKTLYERIGEQKK
jgi:hypothetical protein